MDAEVERLYKDLVKCAKRFGISVVQADLDAEVPGEFDGPTITLNHNYDAVERAFYLAHSIGSIAEWSLYPDRSHKVMGDLQEAKKGGRAGGRGPLKRALAAYLSFENRTWEFAVWLLEDAGHKGFLAAFTNFGRADMEAMQLFHTTGKHRAAQSSLPLGMRRYAVARGP